MQLGKETDTLIGKKVLLVSCFASLFNKVGTAGDKTNLSAPGQVPIPNGSVAYAVHPGTDHLMYVLQPAV